MSIIEKKTLKEKVKIKNYGSLSIYKRDRSPFWWVSFYVSKSYINDKSGFYRQSSKLTNQREAERKAKEIYKNFDFSIVQIKNTSIDWRKDLFLPYVKHKTTRKEHSKNPYEPERDEQQFTQWIEPYLSGCDYRIPDDVEESVNELIYELRDDGKKDVTIVKYISLLSQMFRYAKDRDKITRLPTFPVLTRIIGNQRIGYEPKELVHIENRTSDEFTKIENNFFDEMFDYLRWSKIPGWRQGLEPIMIKHSQVELCNFQNFVQPILRIWVKKTKTNKENYLHAYPQFVDENWTRIMKRNPNPTIEDYVFWPHEKNRIKIWERVRKNFVRFSRELNLYIKDGKTRPMTAIRHGSVQRDILRGKSLTNIALTHNTSEEMIRKVYAHSSNKNFSLQRHIEEYKDYYTRNKKQRA
jgi:hypothetical protein